MILSKTLHLNLKRKWFDMILSGEKEEEYREIKEHWITNLFYYTNHTQSVEYFDEIKDCANHVDFYELCEFFDLQIKDFTTITFSNGYKKDRPQFEIELKNIKIDTGKTEWGAIENEKYFVLELGEILNRSNYE